MKIIRAFCFSVTVGFAASAGEVPARDKGLWATDPIPHPAESWTVDYETGVLWRVTNNTTADYVVLPQMISLRTPEHFRLELGGGELTLRSRFTLLIEPILEGPEDIYLGLAGSPSIEYWCPSRRACLFFNVGGGFGWINSGNEPGGQGQDFTWNWFASGGLRYYLRPKLAISAGVMFQHWSNRGATDPNPGLDALGPILGLSWHF
ncbi:MAG: acyloxyacyl hydrolase [Verrucomicrobiales bacterium]